MSEPSIKKSKKSARAGLSYRQNQRLISRGRKARPKGGGGRATGHWAANLECFKGGPYAGPITLNRSRRWPWASSYAHARDLSPSTDPVR